MMDSLVLWVLSSILAAGVASYLLLLFAGRTPGAPWWFVPAVTALVAACLVVFVHAALPPVPDVAGQVASVVMIAFGGWALCGRARL